MKQRDFVVVVFRILALWFALQGFSLSIQLIGVMIDPRESSSYLGSTWFLVPVFTLMATLAMATLLWKRSPWLVRRIYSDYYLWDEFVLEPQMQPDDATFQENMPQEALPDSTFLSDSADELRTALTLPRASETSGESEPEFLEEELYESAFDRKITVDDIFRNFLMALGVYLLVNAIPAALGHLAYLLRFGIVFETPWTTYLPSFAQILIGSILLSPARILRVLKGYQKNEVDVILSE